MYLKNKARSNGVHIIVLAIGEDLNIMELNGIASRPIESNRFVVSRFSDVPDIMETVINAHYNRTYKND